MPGALFSMSTTRLRRSSNTLRIASIVSCGPVSASTAAACAIEFGFEVDWLCSLSIALISATGAAGEADAPAGHRIGLGHAVHRQRAVLQPRLDRHDRRRLEAVIGELS